MLIAGTQPNWLRVLRAQELLQVVQADKALREIWRQSRLSQPVFERDCLGAIHRYAELVQLMPASEAHHHAHAGGLLTHAIEMLLAALTWRNARLLPEGAAIEVIDAQRDEWTLVVFYAALLHDVAKVVTDLRISWRAKDLEPVLWMPLAGSLGEVAQGRAQAEYLVEFAPKVERDYSAHSRMAVMLLQRMASPAALSMLARQPAAFDALNRYLSGQDRDSLVAQLVREADKASVRRALATGSRARFATAKTMPLVDLLMQSLKSMLRTGTALPLNRSGAAGWVYDGSVWFVAKRVADATRDWIKKHEPEEAVPGETKNDRIFDTWQEYGCIQVNPVSGQAVWYVTVHGLATQAATGEPPAQQGAYQHTLTMLRFPLDKLYDAPSQYPAPMAGSIEVHDKRKTSAQDGRDEDETAQPEEAAAGPSDARNAVAGASKPSTAADADAPHVREAAAGGPDAEAKKHSAKPVVSTPAIKAPTFNKPKPAATSHAPARTDTSNRPAPATRQPVDSSGLVVTTRAVSNRIRGPIDPDEAEYLLDQDDLASEAAMHRAPARRQASKAAKRGLIEERHAQAEQSPREPIETAAVVAPRMPTSPLELLASARKPMPERSSLVREAAAKPAPADPLKALAQPVGGPRPLLLGGTAPPVMGRSRTEPTKTDHAAPAPAGPKPVILEPELPKLPKGDRTEREPVASQVAMNFIAWLQNSLAKRLTKFNETGAAVHFVPEGMALVSPLIFKLYAATLVPQAEVADHAMQIQREVIKAGWHMAGPNRTNIISYQVVGRGGATAGKLAAVVLLEPGRFVQPVPPANPVLKLL